jgi:hypothetical protein
MDDTDRIAAAIFAAGMCQGKPLAPPDYFKAYDRCLEIFREREATAKARRARSGMNVTKAAVERARRPPSKEKPRR